MYEMWCDSLCCGAVLGAFECAVHARALAPQILLWWQTLSADHWSMCSIPLLLLFRLNATRFKCVCGSTRYLWHILSLSIAIGMLYGVVYCIFYAPSILNFIIAFSALFIALLCLRLDVNVCTNIGWCEEVIATEPTVAHKRTQNVFMWVFVHVILW